MPPVTAGRGGRVTLAVRDGMLRVAVADEGRGFDPAIARQGGLGLAGMRERGVLLGGHLRVETAPGEGTRVALDVPLATMGHDPA